MTASEAIEWLKAIEEKYIYGGDEVFDNLRKVAISMAISALEKQIPKKVTDIHVDEYYCPTCESENNKDYSSNRGDDYCPCYGQALDWSDTE